MFACELLLMVIVVKLRNGPDYAIDSYDIDGQFIELRGTSPSGKPQITILPLDDVVELPAHLCLDNPLSPVVA
ncbi:Uncharacterised protein [uncultured archaeon]|nr:Uncharacterised protein [uncultured archaeon]